MSETTTGCYRDRDNGVYFRKAEHRHDCTEADCRGCVTCPETHCTARKSCAWHVEELTCPRCVGRARTDLRKIVERATLMLDAATEEGVNSEAANLAGPAADYGTFRRRRELDRDWLYAHIPEGNLERALRNLLSDDDDQHPYSVLTRWEFMLREDYDLPRETPTSITAAATFLDDHMTRVAQDDEQDFPLLARELHACLTHMESVLHDSEAKDRGVPCPDCTNEQTGLGPRLVREYGHWCTNPLCERMHHDTDEGDRWLCPRNRDHEWSHEDYERYLTERNTPRRTA